MKNSIYDSKLLYVFIVIDEIQFDEINKLYVHNRTRNRKRKGFNAISTFQVYYASISQLIIFRYFILSAVLMPP